jgi:Fe-S-cluster containining protein
VPPLPILNGRRFGCTQCGNCCLEPGYIFMTFVEVERIAEHLGMTVGRFKTDFGLEWDPNSGQFEIDATDGNGCPLLTPDLGCSVHDVKPSQCRTFPFWDELLDDHRAWEDTKRYCPGLDAPGGRLYSKPEIRALQSGEGST